MKRVWRIAAVIYGYLGGVVLVVIPVTAFIDLVLFGPDGAPLNARLTAFWAALTQWRTYGVLLPVAAILSLLVLWIVIADRRWLAKACRREGISLADFNAMSPEAQDVFLTRAVRAEQAVLKSPLKLALTELPDESGRTHGPKRVYLGFDPARGYPAAAHISYECASCGSIVPSNPGPGVRPRCRCGNIAIDVDAGRVSVKDEGQFKAFAEV